MTQPRSHNSNADVKERLRKTALEFIGGDLTSRYCVPFAGFGHCSAQYPDDRITGCDNDADAVDWWKDNRPSAKITCEDVVKMVSRIRGTYCLLDADAFGQPWPCINAALKNKRLKRAPRFALLVTDGIKQKQLRSKVTYDLALGETGPKRSQEAAEQVANWSALCEAHLRTFDPSFCYAGGEIRGRVSEPYYMLFLAGDGAAEAAEVALHGPFVAGAAAQLDRPVVDFTKVRQNAKLCPDLIQNICDAIARGMFVKRACNLVGISNVAYYEWMQKAKLDPDSIYGLFERSVELAEATFINQALGSLVDSGDPRSLQWVLARRFPEYKDRQEVAIEGVGGTPVKVEWVLPDEPEAQPEAQAPLDD